MQQPPLKLRILEALKIQSNAFPITDITFIHVSAHSGTEFSLLIQPFHRCVTKTYNQFVALWKVVQPASPKKIFANLTSESFGDIEYKIPVLPKSTLIAATMDAKMIEARRAGLEAFLLDCCKYPSIRDHKEFKKFLFDDAKWETNFESMKDWKYLFDIGSPASSDEEKEYEKEASQLFIEVATSGKQGDAKPHTFCSNAATEFKKQASTLIELEKYKECIEYCNKSTDALKYSNYDVALLNIMLGQSYLGLKQYDECFLRASKALELFRKEKLVYDECVTMVVLGRVHLMRGEFEKAVEIMENAVSLQQEHQFMFMFASSVNSLAKMYIDARQFQKAIVLLEFALQQVEVVAERCLALRLISCCYLATNCLELARKYLHRAIAFAKSEKNQAHFTDCVFFQAKFIHEPDKVMHCYKYCLFYYVNSGDKNGALTSALALSEWYINAQLYYEANKYIQYIINNKLNNDDLTVTYKINVHQACIYLAIQQPEIAVEYMEQSYNCIDNVTKFPNPSTRYWKHHFADYDSVSSMLHKCIAYVDNPMLQLELFERQRAIVMEHELLKNLSGYAAFNNAISCWNFGKHLGKKEIFEVASAIHACFVYYALQGHTLNIWVIDAAKNSDTVNLHVTANVHDTLGKKSLGSVVQDLGTRFRTGNQIPEEKLLQLEKHALGLLYNLLIEPVKEVLPTDKPVVLIPPGELLNIPFSALYDTTKNQYCIEQYTFVVAKSIGMLYLQNCCLIREKTEANILLAAHSSQSVFTNEADTAKKILNGSYIALEDEELTKQKLLSQLNVARSVIHLIVPCVSMQYAPSNMIDAYQPVGALTIENTNSNDDSSMLYACEIMKLKLFSTMLCLTEDRNITQEYHHCNELNMYDAFLIAGAESCLVTLYPIHEMRVAIIHELLTLIMEGTICGAFREAVLAMMKELNIRYLVHFNTNQFLIEIHRCFGVPATSWETVH